MKWLKEGAQEWVYGHEGQRMLNWILEHQLAMTKDGNIPTFENFKKTPDWRVIQIHLTLEQQFTFRCTWNKFFKIAWQEDKR